MADNTLLQETSRIFQAGVVDTVVRDVTWALEAGHFRAAVLLTYSGIDTMASLVRPEGRERVIRDDFIAWCDRYIRFDGEGHPADWSYMGALRCPPRE